MKRLGIILMVWLLAWLQVRGQLKVGLSGGFVSNQSLFSNSQGGYGMEATASYPVFRQLKVGLSTGLYQTSPATQGSNHSIVPLMAGLEYRLFGIQRFESFIGIDAGLYFHQNSLVENPAVPLSPRPLYGFSPNVGFAYSLSGNVAVHTRIRYGSVLGQTPNFNNLFSISTGVTVDLFRK
jgi:hypothetical protein